MKAPRHITILSGGGSPHNKDYSSGYAWLQEVACRRGLTSKIVDYIGAGHYPDYGEGLSLPKATSKALEEIKNKTQEEGSTLLCQSFGSNVGAYLLAKHRADMSEFKRVIFWGASPFHSYWDTTGRSPDAIEKLNKRTIKKGGIVASDFWLTLSPIEELVKEIQDIEINIGYGTEDSLCDAAFAIYLSALITKHTSCPLRVIEIKGAKHGIRPEPDEGECPVAHERIKREYLDLVFSD